MRKRFVTVALTLSVLLAAVSGGFTAAAAPAAETGLIAWYKFEAIKDTNKIADETGVSGDLTLFTDLTTPRVSLTAGKSGSALRLQNNSATNNTAYRSYALLPANILNDTDDYTISTWVNVASYSNFARLFDFGSEHTERGPKTYMWMTLSNGSNGVYEVAQDWAAGVNVQAMTFTRQTATNTWMHMVVTRDGNNTCIYKNGVLLSKGDSTMSPRGSQLTRAYIGKSQFDGNNQNGYNDPYFNCTVDDFKVYNRALSADNVAEQYLTYSSSDDEAAEVLLSMINIPGDLSAVMRDVTLIQSVGGKPVTWTSSNPSAIAIDGKVTRPDASVHVDLTASVTYGAVTKTKAFRLYVIGKTVRPYEVNIDTSQKGVDISPDMFGLFYEDINFAADGGLYGELIRNRSFDQKVQAGSDLRYWTASGMTMTSASGDGVGGKNQKYARLALSGPGLLVNTGFGGLSVKAGQKYLFEAYVKTADYTGGYSIALQSAGGAAYGTTTASPAGGHGTWKRIAGVVKSDVTDPNARFALLCNGTGTVDIDMISLFPEDTFMGRQNGLRKDLAEHLKDLNPGFVRFPGGCLIEGHVAGATGDACLNNAYRWKDTVGDISERKVDYNIWNSGSLDYYQTFGLGFFEYFQLCEDLDAEPVPVLNVGMACQARNGAYPALALDSPLFAEYVQDALDLIEFCNGDITTTWGAKRAEMGHPEPFHLKYLGIGNEQWGQKYYDRYAAFVKEIRKVYGPDEIILISSSGTASSGGNYTSAWNWINANEKGDGAFAGLVDEHYYNTPQWFLDNAGRYDKFSRAGALVFAGEYAAHGTARANNWESALTEAAYMTGLERNADVVRLASYAPLFNKIGSSQWVPDMIWFNNSDSFVTPNYFIHQMYMQNTGDYTYKTTVRKNTDPEKLPPYRHYGSAGVGTWATAVEYDDYKVVDQSGNTLFSDDFSAVSGKWAQQVAGSWSVSGGVLAQTSATATDCRYYITEPGSASWRGYTITMRAKKNSGAEGFLIPFFVRDNNNYMHLNVGGWNNVTTAIEEAINGTKTTLADTAFGVQTGVWYDFKIVTGEYTVKCYYKTDADADYRQLLSLDLTPTSYGPVYASAVKDEVSGDVIVKVVNYTENDALTRFNMSTAGLNANAKAITMQHGDLKTVNAMFTETLAPVTSDAPLTFDATGFDYMLPAYSMTVLRIPTLDQSKVVKDVAHFAIMTLAGQMPALPATTTVTFADGSAGTRKVTWPAQSPSDYAAPRAFTIRGDVEGTNIEILGIITVNPSSATSAVYYKKGIETNANVSVASVLNLKDTGVTALVIVAQYDSEGRFVKLDTTERYIAPHRAADVAVAYGLPGETVTNTIRTFVWDKDTLIPLGAPNME